jgi:hypothetical protein
MSSTRLASFARAAAAALVSTALASVLVVGLGCVSSELPVSGRAFDPAEPIAPVAPTTGVLGAQFDPKQLAPRPPPASGAVRYSCPHHPKEVSDEPGICRFCRMKLVPTPAASEGAR